MTKTLIIIGILLIILGLSWPLVQKLPLGRLPGDLVFKAGNIRFFFPLTTCIVISVVLSLLFWLFRK